MMRSGALGVAGTAAAIMTLALLVVAAAPRANAEATVKVRGIMDIAVAAREDLRWLNTTNFDDSSFDLMRSRLFVQAESERTQAHVQLFLSDDSRSPVRIYGAYLLHKPLESHELYLEAGRIPTHDGSWAPRVYSPRNPLVGVPLAYYWKTNLPYRMLPADMEALLEQKGRGQQGTFYTDEAGHPRGVPWANVSMIYDSCWNHGVYVLGTERNFEYAVGVTVGPPTAPVYTADNNDDLVPHAKLGYAFTPGLKASVAWAQGAYLSRDVQQFLPPGKSVNEYDQTLWMGSAEASFGHFEFNGEVFVNHYDTPLRDDGLDSFSYYVDGKWDFHAGWFAALRFDSLSYGDVEVPNGGGATTSWDQNIERIEGGVGYHVSRTLLVKGVLQATNVGEGYVNEYVSPVLQVSFSF